MAKNEIELKKADSIVDELDRLHQTISRRAYDLFCSGEWGGELADWLAAERELISKPAVELRQEDGRFKVSAALPGIEAKDLDVQVTPDALLIKAETTHEHHADAGTVHVCEFSNGKIFRSVDFPEKIDPDTATAEYRNGMLRLTASIGKTATGKKVAVKVA